MLIAAGAAVQQISRPRGGRRWIASGMSSHMGCVRHVGRCALRPWCERCSRGAEQQRLLSFEHRVCTLGRLAVVGHDTQGTRFSPLDQIDARNVASLKLAFSFPTGVDKGHEAAPLVIGDTMYVVTPYPEHVYALDLRQPDATVKWKFDPKPTASAQGVACCDVVNRGAAYADGRIFFNTLDTQTIALDAASGRELWRTKLGDISRGETMTMAPLVVKGKVLVGNSGGELGVRGWLTALDAATGKIAWRAWSTGPDKDVLIGAVVQAVLRAGPRQRPRRLDLARRRPGRSAAATSWGFVSYDPELDLIFYGTGNPGPVESRAATRREQVDLGHLRAPARHRRGGLVLPVEPARPARLRRRQRERAGRPADRRARRAGARCTPTATATSTWSIARPAQVLSADPFVPITTSTGVDLADRRARSTTRQKEPRGGEIVAQHLPGVAGRQGLAAVGVVAANAAALHPAPEPVPGRRDLPGQLHRRHALRRRRRRRCTPGRAAIAASSRRGIRSRARRPGREGELSGLERRARDRRRRRLLRHDGRLASRPSTRRPARCSGSSRPAPESSASRSAISVPTASSTSPSSPASAAGPARSSARRLDRARPARRRSASSTR